jgi:HD-GYP domain-containing protein (c-di-GMP phosphodiesterase class II)
VDAADILLLEQETGILHFAEGAGFRSDALRHSHVPLGSSYAGRAALEERVIKIHDLSQAPDGLSRSPHLGAEGFHSYAAAPLVVKGQVMGVLEVFTRTPLEPDPEWMDFLQTLAGQGAIAVDNRSLFERIRNANRELAEAYDRTLEGWSKALELRDHETLGHTMRVLESTLKLARLAGMEEKDLVHVRRGVLLHDIGKMGIPDHILLKPGPLTEEEWVVMKRHTTYAFDLLWPIPFLRPALDIPYCHHERWDGSGYPRGLKGEEIPLSARVFSVVDSWDALSYDRPYRKAWEREKVSAYLKEKAGTHFEPALVELFLREGP